jgi:hypothetical protein
MENLVYVKVTLWIALIAVVLIALVYVIREFRKAGSSVSGLLGRVVDYINPPDPVMPPDLKHFVDEAVNQPGGYTPYVPATEDDESYPPAWLKKGAT